MVFAIHGHESATCVHVSPILNHHSPYPIPLGCPSAPALRALFHAPNLDWWSMSHMIIHMFQCYSLKSSHPHPLPQSPKVCSLHLCLFCGLPILDSAFWVCFLLGLGFSVWIQCWYRLWGTQPKCALKYGSDTMKLASAQGEREDRGARGQRG